MSQLAGALDDGFYGVAGRRKIKWGKKENDRWIPRAGEWLVGFGK
jgi:hypothetical protein